MVKKRSTAPDCTVFWSLGFGDKITNLPTSMFVYSYEGNVFNCIEFIIIISHFLFSRNENEVFDPLSCGFVADTLLL